MNSISGACTTVRISRHLRAWIVAFVLVAGPIAMVYALDKLLPFDIWLLIIMSNCLLTALQTLSVFVVSFL